MTFLSGFSKRKAIKYGSQRPSSSLTAFPKLFVVSNDADIGAELTSRKLAVTLADGTTQVPYGSHSFISSGGSATFTIRAKFDLNSAANQGDTLGYLYYDHTASDQQNRSGVPDSNFKLFCPLEEDPSGSAPQILDWTGNNNGTSHGMSSGDLVSAQVANGLNFDSNSKFVSTPLVLSTGEQAEMTVSAVVKPSLTNTTGIIVANRQSDSGGWFELIQRPTGISLEVFNSVGTLFGAGPFVPSSGQWYQLDGTVSLSAGQAKLYVNGSLAFTASISGSIQSLSHVDISTIFSGLFSFTGTIDEVRLAAAVRPSAWIAFNYQDQFNNAATFTLGAEESAILLTPASFVESHFVSFGSIDDPTWAVKGHVAFGLEAA
jgi:hypothetical protein